MDRHGFSSFKWRTLFDPNDPVVAQLLRRQMCQEAHEFSLKTEDDDIRRSGIKFDYKPSEPVEFSYGDSIQKMRREQIWDEKEMEEMGSIKPNSLEPWFME